MNSKKVINILYIMHDASETGGVTKVLLDLLTSLHPHQINATVILPEHGGLKQILNQSGIPCIIIPSAIFSARNINGSLKYLRELPQRSEKIAKIILEKKIDLVHTHTIFPFEGAIAALKARVPHLWHIHNNPYEDSQSAIFKSLCNSNTTIARIYGTLTDAIVPVSNDAARFFLENNLTGKTQVIHNGIDPSIFDTIHSDSSLKQELNLPKNAYLIATICRVTKQKNIFLFLKSARLTLKAHPNVHFLIIGPLSNKKYVDQLKSFVNKNNLNQNIHFLGSRNDIPTLLKHDINLCIISSDYEGLPIVALEAMTSKTPVISTKCGGTVELIEDHTSGFLVEKNDAQKISQHTINLINNNHLARQIGEAGKQRIIDHFSIEIFSNKFLSAYQKLISKHNIDTQADRLAFIEPILSTLSLNAELHNTLESMNTRLILLEKSSDKLTNNFMYRFFKQVYFFLKKYVLSTKHS